MKQLLLVNDIAGYGKVGMAGMLPILSYMGIPAYNLPTALVSNTLDYGDFAQLDTTEYMRQTLPIWKKLGFHFDAICTGLMFSEEQARLVHHFCKEQTASGGIIFVDPVCGDGGRLYHGIGDTQVNLMREMVSVAHLTIPNYTEACYLTGTPYCETGITRDEACQLLDKLTAIGARSALITSGLVDGKNCVCGYNHNNGEYFFLDYEEIPGLFHGTGDIFSAVLIGNLLNDQPLKESTQKAMDVVWSMIERNRHVDDLKCGILIERCLDLLGTV